MAYRQELLYSSSMRPIVHQVLDREKLLLAELRQALYKLGCLPRHIKQARVDSFTVQPGRKLMRQVMALSATTYKDLTVQGGFAKYPLPRSESTSQVFRSTVLEPRSSTVITEGEFDPTVEGTRPEVQGWRDLDEESARAAVLAVQSIYVGGLPGTKAIR